MKIARINAGLAKVDAEMLKKFGWDESLLTRVMTTSKIKRGHFDYISEDTLCISNINKKEVKDNVWKACTEFYSSDGSAPHKQVILEKTPKGILKSIYNVYLETVKPYDNIRNSEYKAVIAMDPKKVSKVRK